VLRATASTTARLDAGRRALPDATRALEPCAERRHRSRDRREPQLSTTGGTSDGRFIARICPQVVEFGPINASIHKIDEHVAVADIEPLKNIYRRTLARLPDVTLLELIERSSARLNEAGVSFGHGTTNAFDEAVWLVLWRLGLPLDALDACGGWSVSRAAPATSKR
jgi:hypothetical protein